MSNTTEFATADALSKETLLVMSKKALEITEALLEQSIQRNAHHFIKDGKVSSAQFNEAGLQNIAHATAWLKTYVDALSAAIEATERLDAKGKLGTTETLLLQTIMHEYISDIAGGIKPSATETLSLKTLGFSKEQIRQFEDRFAISYFLDENTKSTVKANLVRQLINDKENNSSAEHDLLGNRGLDDEYEAIASVIGHFVEEKIKPVAQELHLEDKLIPQEIIDDMTKLGIFGFTIPEEYGGSNKGTLAMALATEQMASASLAVGSLPTRSEIMAELILVGGTQQQKDEMLPGLANGRILPAILLTEPEAGSDLAALKTTAIRSSDAQWFTIDGKKLWGGHYVRATHMVLLARTDENSQGPSGTSMFIIPKSTGDLESPPEEYGIELERLLVGGYKGMGAHKFTFDGFRATNDCLLGEVEGKGFKHMMQAFEPARIQTAARAVGVAVSALNESFNHAVKRRQSGSELINFDRIGNKIARMAAECFAVRQLTYKAAMTKDSGKRSDLEAATAKMLAPRVANDAATDGVQIHGGYGVMLENPIAQISSDARVLGIFEGASEVQATIIGRRLFEGYNKQNAHSTAEIRNSSLG